MVYRCDMVGCKETSLASFQIAPGTNIKLCLSHADQENFLTPEHCPHPYKFLELDFCLLCKSFIKR